jgi:aspartyl aminopeptidase
VILILSLQVDRNINDNFKFNQETEFVPILGQIAAELNTSTTGSGSGPKKASSIQDNHHPTLLSLLASELSVAPEEIHDFELYVSFSAFTSNPNVVIDHYLILSPPFWEV